MKSLLIETSTERGLVALMQGGELLFHSELPYGYQNSKYLLPHIDAGLKKWGILVRNLDYVAVGVGPGSYTGMRVGAATAKALTFAAKLPLIGICSLKTFVPSEDGPFAVLIDAKIGGVYVVTAVKDGKNIVYHSEPEVVALDSIEDRLLGISKVVTPNATTLKSKFVEHYPHKKIEWEECAPNPRHMNRLAKEYYDLGEFSRMGQLTLMYLRNSR
jgi:tRNA threonylcarbamoyl adenosine modification protein YeaZ